MGVKLKKMRNSFYHYDDNRHLHSPTRSEFTDRQLNEEDLLSDQGSGGRSPKNSKTIAIKKENLEKVEA